MKRDLPAFVVSDDPARIDAWLYRKGEIAPLNLRLAPSDSFATGPSPDVRKRVNKVVFGTFERILRKTLGSEDRGGSPVGS